jgi:hypothetical protein
MQVLNQNHAAPLFMFECPECEHHFIGRGINLQPCPVCEKADILSIGSATIPAITSKDSRVCKFCHLVHEPQDPPLPCLDGVEEHYFEPLPKELNPWLSVVASSNASSKESTVSKPDAPTS